MIDWYDFLGRALQNRRRRRFLNGAHRVQLVEVTVRTNHEILPVAWWVLKRGHGISLGSTICLRVGTGVGEHWTRFRENNAFENEHRKEREQQKTDHSALHAQRVFGFGTPTYHQLEPMSEFGTFRTCRDSLTMSAHRAKADIPPQSRDFQTPKATSAARFCCDAPTAPTLM